MRHNSLCILICLFVRLFRYGNSYIACYAPVATPRQLLLGNCSCVTLPAGILVLVHCPTFGRPALVEGKQKSCVIIAQVIVSHS